MRSVAPPRVSRTSGGTGSPRTETPRSKPAHCGSYLHVPVDPSAPPSGGGVVGLGGQYRARRASCVATAVSAGPRAALGGTRAERKAAETGLLLSRRHASAARDLPFP